MTIYNIYKATCIVNGKSYIGFTNDLPNRVKRHNYWYRKNRQSRLYTAMRKHGWDKFRFEVIYQSKDKDHTFHTMEQYFIGQYDTINNGYNQKLGGKGVIGVVKDTVWVNNGSKHRRVHRNSVPDGWTMGRIDTVHKHLHTKSVGRKISKEHKESGRYKGSKNPAAKSVTIDGVTYGTIREAVKETGLSIFKIKKYYLI
jgi:group I intron endonuclease